MLYSARPPPHTQRSVTTGTASRGLECATSLLLPYPGVDSEDEEQDGQQRQRDRCEGRPGQVLGPAARAATWQYTTQGEYAR